MADALSSNFHVFNVQDAEEEHVNCYTRDNDMTIVCKERIHREPSHFTNKPIHVSTALSILSKPHLIKGVND